MHAPEAKTQFPRFENRDTGCSNGLWNLHACMQAFLPRGLSIRSASGPFPSTKVAMWLCEVLAEVLRSGSPTEQREAVHSLDRLSTLPEEIPKIIAAGAVPGLVQQLRSHSQEVQVAAARVLDRLADKDSRQFMASTDSATSALAELLKSSSAEVQLQAALTLQGFALKAQIASAGAIIPLVQLLTAGSSTAAVKAAAGRTLGIYMAAVTGVLNQAVGAGVIPPLVEGLKSGSTDEPEAAAMALYTASGAAHHKAKVITAGAVPPLVRLLPSASQAVQMLAAQNLAALATLESDGICTGIAEAGAIPHLITMLHSRRPDSSTPYERFVLEAAAMALGRLAVNERARMQIAAAGGIGALVTAMQSGSAATQEHAAMALDRLSSDAGNRAGIAEAAIPALIHLLQSGSAEAQGHAARSLVQLSASPDIGLKISAAGATAPLTRMLHSSSAPLREVAALVLGKLPHAGSDAASAPPSAAPPPSAIATPGITLAAPSNRQQQQPSEKKKKGVVRNQPCWTCGATGVPLKKCSGCAVASYCGADCQKVDWRAHKGKCAGLKAAAAAQQHQKV